MALPTFGTVFFVFSHFCQKICNSFFSLNMIRSKYLGLVKYIHSIQAIILIRLLWLPGISKVCVSFAGNYIRIASRFR